MEGTNPYPPMKCDGIRKESLQPSWGGSTCSFPGAHLSDNFDFWKALCRKSETSRTNETSNKPTNQATSMQETNTHPFTCFFKDVPPFSVSNPPQSCFLPQKKHHLPPWCIDIVLGHLLCQQFSVLGWVPNLWGWWGWCFPFCWRRLWFFLTFKFFSWVNHCGGSYLQR